MLTIKKQQTKSNGWYSGFVVTHHFKKKNLKNKLTHNPGRKMICNRVNFQTLLILSLTLLFSKIVITQQFPTGPPEIVGTFYKVNMSLLTYDNNVNQEKGNTIKSSAYVTLLSNASDPHTVKIHGGTVIDQVERVITYVSHRPEFLKICIDEEDPNVWFFIDFFVNGELKLLFTFFGFNWVCGKV